MDGLRAVGVAVVIASHLPPKIVGDGVAGVELFFVLSGFLITSLLMGEQRSTGGVSLKAFWARRAFRLVPALWVAIMGAAALMALHPSLFRQLAADGGFEFRPGLWIAAAATWTTSLIPSAIVAANPLGVTWSLSIEEQFYLVWPLVFIGLIAGSRVRSGAAVSGPERSDDRPPKMTLAIGLLAILSVASMVVRATGRAGYGAEIALFRFDGILAGCALALWVGTRPSVRVPRWLGCSAWALFALAVLASDARFGSLNRFSATFATLASLPLVLASTNGTVPLFDWVWGRDLVAARVLRDALIWIGRRSYGLYLWHTIALRFVQAVSGWTRWVQVTPVSFVLAIAATAASFRWIEHPFQRRQKALRRWT